MAEIERIGVGPRMSEAVIHGDTIYLSGLVADDLTEDVAGQTRQILTQIDDVLARCGSDRSKLLRTNIWLSTMKDFAAMNSVWDVWVSKGNTPARATVEAKLARPEYLVEIMVVAAR